MSLINDYLQAGFKVLPLQSNKKIPFTTETFTNGFKSATNDIQALKEHWVNYPESNLGIRVGEDTGLIVLDVDVHEVDGYKTLSAIEKVHESLPNTLEVATPTGGKHYYFKLPEGIQIERQINQFAGIDILTNGYVVAPPSSIDGKKYEVINGSIKEIAAFPTWFLQVFDTKKTNELPVKPFFTVGKKYTGAFLDELVAGCANGGRNDWVMRQISKMLNLGADLTTIYKLILVVNENFLDEPLPIKEINATFKSRIKKHNSKGVM